MLEMERAVIAISWKAAITWRFSMLLSLITGPMVLFVNYSVWSSIYMATGKTLIGGYTFEQMMTYIVVSFTLFYLLWDDADESLHEDILTGALTASLLKPLSYMYFQLLHKIGHRFLALLIEYIPVMIMAGFLFGFDIYAEHHIGYFIASIPLAFITTLLINMLIGIAAFWLVKPKGVKWLYRMVGGFLSGRGLPLALFPLFLQKAFIFLPFQYIAYVPAQLFMGNYTLGEVTLAPIKVLFYGVIQVIVLYFIVALAWKISVKRYCGSGT